MKGKKKKKTHNLVEKHSMYLTMDLYPQHIKELALKMGK
jgi:hypothetical protein